MADRRSEAQGESRAKRIKVTPTDMDPKANPYLAHMYNDAANDGYNDGYGSGYGAHSKGFGSQKGSALSKFQRHATTSDMAKKAEDGPNNAFNSNSLSNQYFNILKTRRGLPVHAQR